VVVVLSGFARVAVAVPVVRVADVASNTAAVVALVHTAANEGAQLIVFPELSLSSYTARDLLLDPTLLDACERGLGEVAAATKTLAAMVVVGMPIRCHQGGVYNVAVAVHQGHVVGVVPKSFLPTYREFEERRWFRPGTEVADGSTIRLLGRTIPFGTDLLFDHGHGFVTGLEVCEDVWVQQPPSTSMCSAGATVIANLSASNFTIGKAELRRLLCRAQSDRAKSAYLYVAAGPGESSTDLTFDADAFIIENGNLLAESTRFLRTAQHVIVDVDIDALQRERQVTNTFGDCAHHGPQRSWRRIHVNTDAARGAGIRRQVSAHPFVPKDEATMATRAWEMFEIQTHALITRMQAMTTQAFSPKLVLGLSGGLDSTQAALVCANALDVVGRPRSDLVVVTMPGLGTSAGTKNNAARLARELGTGLITIGIDELSRLVLAAVGHPAATGTATVDELLARVRADAKLGDTTLENAQARMRTLVLMTVANREGGIVVGTGDLSEKALGWSTYSGDHISMYDVNAGIPKTLIQFVIRWVANERVKQWTTGDATALRSVLFDILATPISPELLPTTASGELVQQTESTLGPYELHDFYLYHFVRHGRRPSTILALALHAFGDRYAENVHKRWLTVFLRRFFTHQFKRSCTADGPKVGSVALSPRGDWRMPSDAQVAIWLAELEE
jgi:NAD+ synthase (glutamine-hydrolysing)